MPNPAKTCAPCNQQCSQGRQCPAALAKRRAEDAVRLARAMSARQRVADDAKHSGVTWSQLLMLAVIALPVIVLLNHLFARFSGA